MTTGAAQAGIEADANLCHGRGRRVSAVRLVPMDADSATVGPTSGLPRRGSEGSAASVEADSLWRKSRGPTTTLGGVSASASAGYGESAAARRTFAVCPRSRLGDDGLRDLTCMCLVGYEAGALAGAEVLHPQAWRQVGPGWETHARRVRR